MDAFKATNDWRRPTSVTAVGSMHARTNATISAGSPMCLTSDQLWGGSGSPGVLATPVDAHTPIPRGQAIAVSSLFCHGAGECLLSAERTARSRAPRGRQTTRRASGVLCTFARKKPRARHDCTNVVEVQQSCRTQSRACFTALFSLYMYNTWVFPIARQLDTLGTGTGPVPVPVRYRSGGEIGLRFLQQTWNQCS